MLGWDTDEYQVEHIDGMTIEYPYCLHQRDLTDFVIPWHWHEELELGYIQTGTSIIRTFGQEYIVHQGNGFFINTDVVDSKRNQNPGKPCLEINNLFHPVFLGGHFGSRITAKYLNPVLHNREISVHVIRRGNECTDRILDNLIVLKEMNQKEIQEIQIRNLLSETWLLLMDELSQSKSSVIASSSEKEVLIKKMLAYIHKEYGEKLTLAAIAGSAGVSQREANRIFRDFIGQSPFEYLIEFRLERARQLLRETNLPITEIALSTGFNDGTYFGKVFREKYGLSPREYRSGKNPNKRHKD